MHTFKTPVPGHWNTDEGIEVANTYATCDRDGLAMADKSDFELANAQYLVGRHDPALLSFQTAAKERIRWLSVQLAIANERLDQKGVS